MVSRSREVQGCFCAQQRGSFISVASHTFKQWPVSHPLRSQLSMLVLALSQTPEKGACPGEGWVIKESLMLEVGSGALAPVCLGPWGTEMPSAGQSSSCAGSLAWPGELGNVPSCSRYHSRGIQWLPVLKPCGQAPEASGVWPGGLQKEQRKEGSLPRVGVFRGGCQALHTPLQTPSLGLRPRPKLHRLWAGMRADGGSSQA